MKPKHVTFTEQERKSGQGDSKLYAMEVMLRDIFNENYDDIYGGCWLDDNYEPYFAMTYINEDMIIVAKATQVTLVEVKYSYAQLEDIIYYMPVSKETGIYSAAVVQNLNAVEIEIDEAFLESVISLIQEDEYLSKFEDIIIITLGGRIYDFS